MRMNDPTNKDDVIDSRDVISRFEELEEQLLETYNKLEEERSKREGLEFEEVDADDDAFESWVQNAEEIDAEEYLSLKKLIDQAEGVGDWVHGAVLIRDDHFEAYARELAWSIEAIKENQTWPYNHIDWAAAANELQMDYTSVEFDDVTYWVRS